MLLTLLCPASPQLLVALSAALSCLLGGVHAAHAASFCICCCYCCCSTVAGPCCLACFAVRQLEPCNYENLVAVEGYAAWTTRCLPCHLARSAVGTPSRTTAGDTSTATVNTSFVWLRSLTIRISQPCDDKTSAPFHSLRSDSEACACMASTC